MTRKMRKQQTFYNVTYYDSLWQQNRTIKFNAISELDAANQFKKYTNDTEKLISVTKASSPTLFENYE